MSGLLGTLRIATRESALALWQAKHIKQRLEKAFSSLEVELVPMTSKGDQILDRPLALVGGKGHFTKALEDAMLEGRADMAVHSLKDVPTSIPQGLELAAVTTRQDQSDLFLSYRYASFDALPHGAVVGTTSLRRRMQLALHRPDLRFKDLRGNVNTRLRKLKEGEYDAIVLAYIGLERLGLIENITYTERLEFMIPPMGQASLGIEIVSNCHIARKVATFLNDESSFICAHAERQFVAAIGAGCSAPVAVHATLTASHITIKAMVGMADGSEVICKSLQKPIDQSKTIGKELAKCMIDQGALTLLRKAEDASLKTFRAERF